jgi:hypothetical protein
VGTIFLDGQLYSPDRPSLLLREQNSSMKNRKREICTSRSVRDEDGNILIPATPSVPPSDARAVALAPVASKASCPDRIPILGGYCGGLDTGVLGRAAV